jgi:hypothetical protein
MTPQLQKLAAFFSSKAFIQIITKVGRHRKLQAAIPVLWSQAGAATSPRSLSYPLGKL